MAAGFGIIPGRFVDPLLVPLSNAAVMRTGALRRLGVPALGPTPTFPTVGHGRPRARVRSCQAGHAKQGVERTYPLQLRPGNLPEPAENPMKILGNLALVWKHPPSHRVGRLLPSKA
jgi:hypothetical protein